MEQFFGFVEAHEDFLEPDCRSRAGPVLQQLGEHGGIAEAAVGGGYLAAGGVEVRVASPPLCIRGRQLFVFLPRGKTRGVGTD